MSNHIMNSIIIFVSPQVMTISINYFYILLFRYIDAIYCPFPSENLWHLQGKGYMASDHDLGLS